jgi:hypothetical protein
MKKLFKTLSLLSVLTLGASGCNLNNKEEKAEPNVNEKMAYASSSALNLVSGSSPLSLKKMQNDSSSEGGFNLPDFGFKDAAGEMFKDYIEQFDVLLEAKTRVNVEVKENSEGEYKYSSIITIGEGEDFTYILNYNTKESDNVITQEGVLVVSYLPLDYDYSLNFLATNTFLDDENYGTINFKLFINVFNKEDKTTYVEVNETINNSTQNDFQYKMVIANTTIMNYSISIPVAEEGKITVSLNGLVYSIEKSVSEDNVTTIVITMLVSDKGGMSFTYEKIVNEDGTFTYTYKASQII